MKRDRYFDEYYEQVNASGNRAESIRYLRSSGIQSGNYSHLNFAAAAVRHLY